MGRKKFHLVVRKNERRRRAAAVKPELKVSVCRVKLPVKDVSHMSGQLLQSLPPQWIVQNAERKIIICQLDATVEPPMLRYSITVRENFTWLFTAFGNSISPQSCRMLAGLSDRLNSVKKVMQVISIIGKCRLCAGNSESKFLEVAKRCDGIFKDHCGKHHTICRCSMCTTLPHYLILSSGIVSVKCYWVLMAGTINASGALGTTALYTPWA